MFGLYLDGASWDSSRSCLQDSLSGQRFYPLPKLLVTPTQVITLHPTPRKPCDKAKSRICNLDFMKDVIYVIYGLGGLYSEKL